MKIGETDRVLLFLLICGSAQGSQLDSALSVPVPSIKKLGCVGSQDVPRVWALPPAFRDCVDTPIMVALPRGRFKMGDLLGNGLAYERPVHDVSLPPFAIGRYEVSQSEWAICENEGACGSLATPTKAADLPASNVNWYEAQQYVAWLSARTNRHYRLPSEAEWEYAARAGSDDRYTWGNYVETSCLYANAFDQKGHRAHPDWNWQIECDDGYAEIAPIGRFPPNAWGLNDMLGNLWEWVEDCWHSDYEAAPADGGAWQYVDGGNNCRKRVNRGGGWGNHPRSLRVSSRDADPPLTKSNGLGFRVARDLTP